MSSDQHPAMTQVSSSSCLETTFGSPSTASTAFNSELPSLDLLPSLSSQPSLHQSKFDLSSAHHFMAGCSSEVSYISTLIKQNELIFLPHTLKQCNPTHTKTTLGPPIDLLPNSDESKINLPFVTQQVYETQQYKQQKQQIHILFQQQQQQIEKINQWTKFESSTTHLPISSLQFIDIPGMNLDTNHLTNLKLNDSQMSPKQHSQSKQDTMFQQQQPQQQHDQQLNFQIPRQFQFNDITQMNLSAEYSQSNLQQHVRQQWTVADATTASTAKKKRRRVITTDQRRAANIRERKRMSHLNEAFDGLRKKVPTFAYEKKLSRIETLKLAVTYIKFMSDLIKQVDSGTFVPGNIGSCVNAAFSGNVKDVSPMTCDVNLCSASLDHAQLPLILGQQQQQLRNLAPHYSINHSIDSNLFLGINDDRNHSNHNNNNGDSVASDDDEEEDGSFDDDVSNGINEI